MCLCVCVSVCLCVCSVCRTGDRACLHHLVFNMHSSDVVKFDEFIRHNNSTMDKRTRAALYRKIRGQVAHNFDQANKDRVDPICRYCRLTAGGLNEYVAFVVFSDETAEFVADASTSQDEPVPPDADGKSSVDTETNISSGKTRSAADRAKKERSKMVNDNVSETRSQSCETLGEIKQRKVDEGKEILAFSCIQERRSDEVDTTEQSTSETCAVRRNIAEHRAGISPGIKKPRDRRHKVIGEITAQKADVEKTPAVLVDEPSATSKPDEPMDTADRQQEQAAVTKKQDGAELSAAAVAIVTTCSPPHDHEVNSEVKDFSELAAAGELHVWRRDTKLQLMVDGSGDDAEFRNTEYKKLSDWLASRTGSTTAFHRYPTLYDLPVLAPRENPERSVTWRLADRFMPSNHRMQSNPGLTDNTSNEDLPDVPAPADVEETSRDRKSAASDVVFIGPYDASVIQQGEVVRRRVRQICEDMLPQSSADILCVTDVGSDVSVTGVSDIVDTSQLSAAQCVAYTALDTSSTRVSCVLLRFSPAV